MRALFKGSLAALVALMVIFPAQLQVIKAAMLVLALFSGSLSRGKGWSVDRGLVYWMIVYILSGVFFSILSFANGNDVVFHLPIVIFEPMVFLVLIALIDDDAFAFLCRALIPISYGVALYDIFFTLSINGIVFQDLGLHAYMPGIKGNYGGVFPGFVKFTAENITWMQFLAPLFIAVLLTTSDSRLRRHSFAITVLFLACSVLCIRTAFFGCIALGFVLTPLFARAGNAKSARRAIRVSLAVCVCCFAIVILGGGAGLLGIVADDVAGSLSMGSSVNSLGMVDNGSIIRRNQLFGLIDSWSQRPLFGWGDPANSNVIVRSDTIGAYELSYVAMLMQRGIVGSLIYVAQIVWLYWRGLKVAQLEPRYSSAMLCLLVAFSAALFSNFFNPYFGNFDRLIIQFAPLIIINLAGKRATCDGIKFSADASNTIKHKAAAGYGE